MIKPISLAASKTFRESSNPGNYCSDILFTVRSGSEAHGVRELLIARTRTCPPRPLAGSGLSLSSQDKEGRGISCQLHRAAPPTNRTLAPRAFRGPLRKMLEGL